MNGGELLCPGLEIADAWFEETDDGRKLVFRPPQDLFARVGITDRGMEVYSLGREEALHMQALLDERIAEWDAVSN